MRPERVRDTGHHPKRRTFQSLEVAQYWVRGVKVAIWQQGKVHSAGRIATSIEQLELLRQSLGLDDVVVLKATSGAGLIVELLERHVARVLVANTRKLPQGCPAFCV